MTAASTQPMLMPQLVQSPARVRLLVRGIQWRDSILGRTGQRLTVAITGVDVRGPVLRIKRVFVGRILATEKLPAEFAPQDRFRPQLRDIAIEKMHTVVTHVFLRRLALGWGWVNHVLDCTSGNTLQK